MRLYSKKILRKRIDKRIGAKRETRDAIIWDILPTDRVCRVKIQGSNTLIVAHYPLNWTTIPEFIKPGNAVKINHQGGATGKIEIVGHGQLVPSPVSGTATPTIGTGTNTVLSGLKVFEMPDATGVLKVWVSAGSYRIDGVTYTLDAMTLEELSDAGFGDSIFFGQVAGVVELNAAPVAGYFRIDLISIGIDGVIDYTVGIPAPSSPATPSVAASHVQLATILIHGGMTTITNTFINMTWTVPVGSVVRASLSDDVLSWGSETTTIITVSIEDQYGNPFFAGFQSMLFVVEFVSGTGTLQHAVSCTRSELLTSGGSRTFMYTRIGSGDASPLLTASVELGYILYAVEPIYIILEDSDEEIMVI